MSFSKKTYSIECSICQQTIPLKELKEHLKKCIEDYLIEFGYDLSIFDKKDKNLQVINSITEPKEPIMTIIQDPTTTTTPEHRIPNFLGVKSPGPDNSFVSNRLYMYHPNFKSKFHDNNNNTSLSLHGFESDRENEIERESKRIMVKKEEPEFKELNPSIFSNQEFEVVNPDDEEEDIDICSLARDFHIGGGKTFRPCKDPLRGNYRVVIYNGVYNLVLCRLAHFHDTMTQSIIRDILRCELKNDSVQERVNRKDKESIVHCALKKHPCTMKYKLRATGLPNTKDSFLYFCNFKEINMWFMSPTAGIDGFKKYYKLTELSLGIDAKDTNKDKNSNTTRGKSG